MVLANKSVRRQLASSLLGTLVGAVTCAIGFRQVFFREYACKYRLPASDLYCIWPQVVSYAGLAVVALGVTVSIYLFAKRPRTPR
jgi:hypothetical protein